MNAGPRRRHDWRPRERPRWWPEGEPFPPSDWRPYQRRFMRRFVGFAIAAFIVFTLFMTLLVALVLSFYRALTSEGATSPILLIVGVLALLMITSGAARGVRRIVAPLGDLIEAAGRVESGDYSVRVRVRGPRELRALGRAFNDMSAHLGSSEAERTRLLADVTHELRTPLTVIQGNIEALIDGVHPADPAHLRAILDETQVLSRLIDDLRTVSIAEAGALALHREETDIGRLVGQTVSSFDAQATGAGVTLKADADGAGEAEVDPIRIREVLTNVIANALRYTPRGGSIDVSSRGENGRVTIVVRDSGAGIDPEVLPHIFERFTHAPDSPGAGLGLAIAKSIVALHGGTISAASEPGLGTEVRFTLPRRTAAS